MGNGMAEVSGLAERMAMAEKFAAVHLTERSLALFLEFANDAGNWDGQPMVGGNVIISKEDRGNLTQLKRADLVETYTMDGHTWLRFTPRGKALAKHHGIEV